MMMPFDHKNHNPSGFACLMLITAFVLFTPLRIYKKKKKKNKLNGPFPSSHLPPLQLASLYKCEVFVMVISSILQMNEN